MRSRFPASVGLGRWGRLTVRLHVFFLAFAAATLYLCWPADSAGTAGVAPPWTATGDLRGIAVMTLVVLFFSVWWHELAHWWVARHFGVQPGAIVLGPLGGLTPWSVTQSAGAELSIWSAGPAANLSVGLACAGWLSQRSDSTVISWNPFQPACFTGEESGLVHGVQLIFWVNWLLFLLNMLPAYPFDGGRVFRAAIRRVQPAWNSSRVDRWVDAMAMAAASVLLVAALELWRRQGADTLFPSWLPLLLLSVLMLVGVCRPAGAAPESVSIDSGTRSRVRQSRGREVPRSPQGTSRSCPAIPRQEASAAQAVPEQDRASLSAEQDVDEERQIDAILSRVHAHGIQSLSAQERLELERASARYRSRLGRRP